MNFRGIVVKFGNFYDFVEGFEEVEGFGDVWGE